VRRGAGWKKGQKSVSMTSIGKGSCRATGREPAISAALSAPSVPVRVAEASGFSSRSSPSPPSSLSRVRTAVHRSLELAKVSGGDIRARGNWPHVKQPAICNPGGLILRGNDDSGTTPLAPARLSLRARSRAFFSTSDWMKLSLQDDDTLSLSKHFKRDFDTERKRNYGSVSFRLEANEK